MTFHYTAARRPAVAALLGLAAALAFGTSALAMPVCGVEDSCIAPDGGAGDETRAFVGLRWDFGSEGPALVAGVRYTNTDEDARVYGGQIDLALKLGKDEDLAPTVRLLGLAGNTTVMGEAGVGIDTATWQALIAGAVQVPNVAVGANYLIGGELAPYVEVNLLSKPSGSALSCPDGYALYGVTDGKMDGKGYPVEDSMINDSHTCFRPPVL